MALPGETVTLKDDSGFAGKEVERETLNTIIHMRVRETLELLRRHLESGGDLHLMGAGIFITGGSSLLRGIDSLAQEIFELPVHITHAQTMSGLTSAFENPQFSTAIGLIKYAQAVQMDRPSGWLSKFAQKLPIFGRRR
jgi:cell division protein FtsA